MGKGAKETPAGSLHYEIEIGAAAACAIGPKPLSWGWLTIILFGVTLLLYFGGGTGYNMRYRGEEGMDAIPQWAYWQQLPGLVKDGNHFFWVEGRIMLRQGRKGFRNWYDNRGTQELRAPIAAADHGAGE